MRAKKGGALPAEGGGQPTNPDEGLGMRTKEVQGIESGDAKATNPAMMQGPEGTPDMMGFMSR